MEYLYFSVGMQIRIPIKENGIPGKPEVTRKWTKEVKDTLVDAKANKAKKTAKEAEAKRIKQLAKQKIQEELNKATSCGQLEL